MLHSQKQQMGWPRAHVGPSRGPDRDPWPRARVGPSRGLDRDPLSFRSDTPFSSENGRQAVGPGLSFGCETRQVLRVAPDYPVRELIHLSHRMI